MAEVVRNSEYRRRSRRITQPTSEACGERQVVAVAVPFVSGLERSAHGFEGRGWRGRDLRDGRCTVTVPLGERSLFVVGDERRAVIAAREPTEDCRSRGLCSPLALRNSTSFDIRLASL